MTSGNPRRCTYCETSPLVIPGPPYIVMAPLCMSMDPRNWPCEPVSLFCHSGRVGLAVPSLSHKHCHRVRSPDRTHCHGLSAAHTSGSRSHSPGSDPSPVIQVSPSITVHAEHTNAFLPPQPLQPLQYPPFPLCSPSSTRCPPSSGAQLSSLLRGPASLGSLRTLSPLSC